MKLRMNRSFCAAVALAMLCGSSHADAPASATSKVVEAANAFLKTLDAKQHDGVMYKFDDDKQRATWSNFPTSFVKRGGLSLKEMNDTQRTAAMALVASALSPRGYEKVLQIMEADEVLKSQPDNGPGGGPPGGGGPSGGGPGGGHDGGAHDGGGPRGGGGGGPRGGGPGFRHDGPIFGKDLYYISILGTPSETDPWMLQFGGHHLALNLTIVAEHGILTPTLTGAQPAMYESGGKTIRPLGNESDKAFALLDALDETQRKQAILSYEVADLVLGPGHDGETVQPEGLKGSSMNAKQRGLLLDLISEWSGIVNDSYATARMEEIKAGLDQTWFAWSGPITHEQGKNGKAYYRIQGPKLVIEYAPQGLGGDLSMHIHTMYRDPTNDYGRAFLKK